ncbi:Cupin domain-containing protein [Gammaproteobacteria bacterium]
MSYKDVLIKKPWGHEYLCYQNEVLAIWFLHIEKNQRTSLHCHPNKHSGYVVLDGVAELSFLRGKMLLKGLDKVHIFRSRFHSTQALSDEGAFILEIETPEDKHDLVRLEDAYGRQGKSYEGKEFEFPKGDNFLWIGEPGGSKSVNVFKGCSINHISPKSAGEIQDFPEQDFFVVTRGGIQANVGSQILWPGDVIDGVSLCRLSKSFELIFGTTLLYIKKISTDDSIGKM